MPGIVTLTLNPALDVSSTVGSVVPDRKLRCSAPERDPGGGGVNVARVVHILGGEATAVWTCGGHTGSLLQDLLSQEGVSHRPVPIEGMTRESLMIFEEATGEQYRFQFPGPELTAEEIGRIRNALVELREGCDYLVLSGSLPPGAPTDLYAQLAAAVGDGIRVLVDTSGEALRETVRQGVFLIKPNIGELCDLVGERLESDEDIARAGRKLLEAEHAEVVAVSLGAGGAMVVTRQGCEHVRSPTVPIRSKVGAGDSMVGGTVLGLSRGLGTVEAVRFGVAAGAAAVMTPGSKLCRRDDAERLYQAMRG
ncbi:MAG: 1-phosphofructokinase family hexose kinase [Myxococcota bacterium]